MTTRRAWNSTLPARTKGLARSPLRAAAKPLEAPANWPAGTSKPPKRRRGLSRKGRKVLKDGRAKLTTQSRPESFPRKVCRLIDRRDSQPDGIRRCVRCGTSRGPFHRHHRRVKGMGGDTRPCTDCLCNSVTLCWLCHSFAHAHPEVAKEDGFIIPSSATEPGLFPVLVFEADESGAMAYATCDGRWVGEAPAARGVALCPHSPRLRLRFVTPIPRSVTRHAMITASGGQGASR